MKITVKAIALFLLFPMLAYCKNQTKGDDYLHRVLSNLQSIESASYRLVSEGWQSGDTVAVSTSCRLVNEYNNPADTTIGACFIQLDCSDREKASFGYDGKIRALFYDDLKRVVVDDFTARPLPFRPLTPPFFNYARNILEYALTTSDSINLEHKEEYDHHFVRLTIREKKSVEFFGKAYYGDASHWDPTSIYEIWISKSDDLPYKIRREMSHDISVQICTDVELKKLSLADFNLYSYFPAHYEIMTYAATQTKKMKPQVSPLVGQKAPGWTLNDMHEQPVSIDDFKSKVLLVNFTGIGCGPCQSAIPFLKEMKASYSSDEFDVVSIETWSRRASALQAYSKKNELNYKLLNATDDVTEEYQTGRMAPVFFILNKDRIIRKVIKGYAVGSVDKEIEQAVKELL